MLEYTQTSNLTSLFPQPSKRNRSKSVHVRVDNDENDESDSSDEFEHMKIKIEEDDEGKWDQCVEPFACSNNMIFCD